MTDFIKKLEKKFDTQIIYSKEHIWENYYDVDNDGNVITLYLDEIDLKDLDILLPIADNLVCLGLAKCNIGTLKSLKSFINLEVLDLSLNRLHGSTLEHLSHMKKLKKLDLSGTNLKDTSCIGGLDNLEMLFIGGSDSLYEINGLEGLKSLFHLDASNSCINSIESICANENIRILNLEGTDIEKITHLERFPNLENLNLNSTFVETMEGLKTSKNLKKLFLSTWRIKRIEGLENLSKLEVLDLNLNEILKIEGLENLTNLKRLNLSENKISKVENLDHLINLEFLTFEINKIKEFDTSFLSNLVSECFISLCFTGNYIKEIKDVPKNVTIKFEADHFVPRVFPMSNDLFR